MVTDIENRDVKEIKLCVGSQGFIKAMRGKMAVDKYNLLKKLWAK